MLSELSMKKIVFLLLIVVAGWKFFNNSGSVSLGPGVLAADIPKQENIWTSVSRKMGDYSITELKTFNIKAKVLAKKNYYTGREADLSPTDLALGWGRMSDESIISKIKITQSNRFYFWRVDSFHIPRREIETHSANMHLIPANDSVARDIANVQEGEIIEISGSLVEITTNDGWRWKSSLTRNDTGAGACEVILVESISTSII